MSVYKCEGRLYDNVCKFLAETFSADLSTWLLGRSIALTQLDSKELSLEPTRADSLILQQSENIVLHIEFQTSPDKTIPFRMADYRLRVYRRYPKKEMVQVVIYLRETQSALVSQTQFRLERTQHEFDVIRLWEQPADLFLNQTGLLPFAVLGASSDRESTLDRVAQEIVRIEDPQLQSNVAASTAVLAGLVLDKDDISKILRRETMRESVIFQDIWQEAWGEAWGEAWEEATEAARQKVALKLLQKGMSPEQIAEVTELTIPQILELQKQIP